jgi:hypothetical protein
MFRFLLIIHCFILLSVNLFAANCITGNPSNKTVCVGGSTTFIIASNGNPTFQWQVSTNSGSSWSNLSNGATIIGANNDTLSLSNLLISSNNNLFRCIANDNGACIDTSSNALLTVFADPTITSNPTNNSICQGGSSNFSVTVSNGISISYQWQYSSNNSTFSNITNNTPVGASYTGAGTNALSVSGITAAGNHYYKCVVTDAGNGCASPLTSNSATLTVNTDPSITSNPTDKTICQGGSSSFSVSVSNGNTLSYQWQYSSNNITFNNVVNNTPSGASYTTATTNSLSLSGISAAGNHYYRCVVTDAGNGCTSPLTSNSATLTVNTDPTITSNPTNKTICQGGSSDFSVSVSNGNTLSYQWQYSSNNSTFSNVTNNTPTGAIYTNASTNTLSLNGISAAGNHYYRCIVSDAGNGCTSPLTSNSASLTVITDPAITSNPTDKTVCQGGTSDFSVSVSNGISLSYQWQYSSNNITFSNVANNTPSGATYSNTTTNTLSLSGISVAGNHYYRCVVTDAGNGCTSPLTSNSATLTVITDPAITSNPTDKTICQGGFATMNVNVANGISLTYQWQYTTDGSNYNNVSNNTPTGAIYTNASTNTLSVSGITSLGNHQFRCVVSDAGNGCTSPLNSSSAIINVIPVPVPIVSSSDTICKGQSTNLYVTGGVSYLWSPSSSISFPYISNPIASPLSTTNYTVTVTGANGCTSNANINIVVNQLPTISTNNDTVICLGGTVQLNASGGNNYFWSPAAGLSNPYIANPTSNPSVSTVYTLSVTNSSGCTNSSDVYIKVNPLPSVSAGNNVSVCKGSSTTLTASGANSYSWFPSSSLSSSATTSVVANPQTNTIYTVIGTDLNGCSNSSQVTVVVNELPIINISANDTICKGESAQLYASGGSSYSWSPSSNLNFQFTNSPIASPLNNTTYHLTVSDNNGCLSIDSVKIIVNPLPTISVTGASSVCIGDTLNLTATGGVTYQWSPGNSILNSNSNIASVYPITSTTYTVIGTSTLGCSANTIKTIQVNQLPIANAGNDISICKGGNVTLNGTGGTSYTWSPALGLSNTFVQNPIANPSVNSTYTLVVTDANGCIASDQINIEVISNQAPTILGTTSTCQNAYWIEYSTNTIASQYLWSTNNGSIMSGEYTEKILVHWSQGSQGKVKLTVSDPQSSCLSSDSLIVTFSSATAPDTTKISLKGSKILICEDSTFTTYKWGYEDKTSRTPIYSCENTQYCNFPTIDLNNNYYWVIISKDNSCETKSYFNTPKKITSIEQTEINKLNFYPNPVNDILYLDTEVFKNSNKIDVQIFDINGKLVHVSNLNESLKSVNVKELKSGMYFIKLNDDKNIYTTKIIKQ